MGVILFGAAFWALGYLALIKILDTETIRKVFIFGVVSIPAIGLIKLGATLLLQQVYPVGIEKMYERSLKENAVMKVLFVITFYHLVAKQSSNPLLTLFAGAVLFTLAIPEHLFRLWTFKEAPDRSSFFILDQSSLLHRVVIVTLA